MNTHVNSERILCYGDSITWGYRPATNYERIPANKRWTGILQDLLGNNYEILEEGLNSRTLDSEDLRPGKEGRKGSETLIPILDTHDPVDLVILLLGINELKDTFEKSVQEVGTIVEEKFIKVILNRKSQFRETTPKLLLVAPHNIDISKKYAADRYSRSQNKSKQMTQIYEEIAKRNSCRFLDSSKIVQPGEDGVHLDKDNHEMLGQEMYKKVLEILK
jgi:lysophospholipase L1-like esterase